MRWVFPEGKDWVGFRLPARVPHEPGFEPGDHDLGVELVGALDWELHGHCCGGHCRMRGGGGNAVGLID